MYVLYNDDCFNVFSKLPDKSIDMILCDLPYGQTHNKWDNILPLDKLWFAYKRIAKDTAPIILFASGLFSSDLIQAGRDLFRYSLVWDKGRTTGFLNANRMPLRRHEDILVFYKKLPTYNPQMEEGGEPSHSRGKKYEGCGAIMDENKIYGTYKHTAKTDCYVRTEKFPTSILTLSNRVQNNIHPTQKPVALCEYLIKTYSNENNLVLDNCMGSGTTGVACKNLNRNFIGIEKDYKYFGIAKQCIHEVEKE